MSMTEPNDQRPSTIRFMLVPLTLAAAATLYFLSAGPVARYYYPQGRYLNGFAGQVYEPLWRLGRHSDTLNRLRNWYVCDVWGVHWE
jgi:hypothetical protein